MEKFKKVLAWSIVIATVLSLFGAIIYSEGWIGVWVSIIMILFVILLTWAIMQITN